MGFAVVDVNMRGTGCSGGAFDFFEPLQSLDGYDVIETIAAPAVGAGSQGRDDGDLLRRDQPAVHGPAQPAAPRSDLAAVGSRRDRHHALSRRHAQHRLRGRVGAASVRPKRSPPGPNSGQPYAYKQIQGGDTTCAANQVLHGEAANLSAKIAANAHYDAAVADPLDPVTFVHKIKVPVFMACQWEDEQTGGHCAELVRHFTGTTQKWFNFTNGAHIDSLDPYTYNRWYDFLQLFVAHEAPVTNAAIPHAAAPVIYQAAMGLPQTDVVTMPADPIQSIPTYDAALAAFKQLPRVRVLFDNGAGAVTGRNREPRRPLSRFRAGLLVPSDPRHHRAHLVPRAGGNAERRTAGDRGRSTRSARTRTRSRSPTTAATPVPAGCGATRRSGNGTGSSTRRAPRCRTSPRRSPRTRPSSGAGPSYLWVRSSTPDVDLQATISEVRPDGNETFVQNGWIRASERKLSTNSNNMFKRPGIDARADPHVHEGRRVADAGRQVREGRRSRSTTRATRTAPARVSG